MTLKANCLNCGIEIDISFGRKFCSGKCRSKYHYIFEKIERFPKKCIQCGKEYIPKAHANISKYCSNYCASKYYYKNNPESYKKSYEKRKATGRLSDVVSKYGITADDYNNKLIEQNNVCAICGKEESSKSNSGGKKRLAVDHNHNTGKVRGLLCHKCNIIIGNCLENICILKNSIEYLNKYNTNN